MSEIEDLRQFSNSLDNVNTNEFIDKFLKFMPITSAKQVALLSMEDAEFLSSAARHIYSMPSITQGDILHILDYSNNMTSVDIGFV